MTANLPIASCSRRRRLCQGDCDCHARALYRARRETDWASDRTRRNSKNGEVEVAKKKSVHRTAAPLYLSLSLVRPSFLLRPLLVNSFSNVQIPRLSVVLEFFQVGVERTKERATEREKVDISGAGAAAAALSLSPLLSEHRQLLRDGRSTDADVDRIPLRSPFLSRKG